MASARESPPELSTCTNCEAPYDYHQHKAVALSCDHTFCSHCLNQCYRKKGQEKLGSIQCPNCDQLTYVPANWVAALPTGIYDVAKKEKSKEAEGSKPVGNVEGRETHGNYQTFLHTVLVVCVAVYFHILLDRHCNIVEEQLQKIHTTQTEIQGAIHEMKSDIQTIQDKKDSSTESLVAFIQFAKRHFDHFEQEVTDAISNHHVSQHGKLSREKWPVLNDILHSIVQTYFQSILPTSVEFRNGVITAGLESVITLEVFNGAGNTFLFTSCFLTVQITDPEEEELPVTVSTINQDCTLTFTPRVSGKHQISIICLGQTMRSEQTHIIVDSNNPVLKFGKKGNGKGTFKFPSSIVTNNDGVLYVADSGNRLIQKFSDNGGFISQFIVNNRDEEFTVVDMALDPISELIFCVEDGYKDGKYYPKTNMLVFNLKGKRKHSYHLNSTDYPGFITINNYHDILITDIRKKCIHKFDKHGKYLSSMGNFNLPTFVTISDYGSIIMADTNDDCIYILNPDGTIKRKFGSFGTGKGQLDGPYGVATDGEYILVVDGANNRIQVFKNNGEFVSMIESKGDPLKGPYGLAVTRDGHVYVADRRNHCIKKYKYRHVA